MYLQIGLCGALGAVSRYAISCWVGTHPFPLSTLIVNLAGCFALALVNNLSGVPQKVRTAVGTGFIGAFTTFSTFSKENAVLLLGHNYILLALNIAVSMLGGLCAAYVGTRCGLMLCARAKEGKQ
ncbi:fluoride efflux transporter FluC [Butyricicoccus porcorum]|uniref:Fluoride-specific ion channel FluC n=1 Tax=Butyricicoccus porcorum TaxID=1945634 RepID=A0A252F5G0_9FIRM|nr:CrcB family protein [Butyricicoccus porcorum]OUM20962.1 hypothetical protein CBW42_05110 [Butyricicoccus porcorum]